MENNLAAVPIPDEQRLRLSAVSWDTYVTTSDGLGPRHIRVTYDRGELEILTPSSRHEHNKSRFARLIEGLTLELDIDIASFGSMTSRREEMLKGLEPDECYWIEHELKVRGREDIDLNVDPPPDLALEVEISRSSLDRMGIYAALGVPEVWRWDAENLRVMLLTSRGAYRGSERSKNFSFLPLEEFRQFLGPTDKSETQL